MADRGEEDEMVERIYQQHAMIEQQRQEDLLRRQHSAMQEIAQESMSEHEMEMQRQMMSVMPGPPQPTFPASNFGNNIAPPGSQLMGPPPSGVGMQNIRPMMPPGGFNNGSQQGDQMMRVPVGSNQLPGPPGIGQVTVPPAIQMCLIPPPTPHQVGPPGTMPSNPLPIPPSNQMPANSGLIGPPPNQQTGPPGMGSQLMGPPNRGNIAPPGMGPPPLSWSGSSPDQRSPDDGPSKPQRHQNTSNLPSLLSLKVEKPEELKKKVPDVVLPKALEEALAFKDQRAAALGTLDDSSEIEKPTPAPVPAAVISSEYDAEDDEGDSDEENEVPPGITKEPSKQEGAGKANKNRRKKKRKKLAKANRLETKKEEQAKKTQQIEVEKVPKPKGKEAITLDAEIEYIQENIQFHELEPMYRQFHRIFEVFKISDSKLEPDDPALQAKLAPIPRKPEKVRDQFEVDEETEEKKANDEKERLSKRKLKKLSRLSVAELKQLVSRPDVVEMYDVTARDPKLLVQLKAHRNTVQVPRHWCYKRKYLQGKRGIEKPAFDLPDFIKKTGIMEMRASLQDKEETKTLKAKMRERARPKLGKIDIDYQKLHDAFFKWQTKPRMTIHGDLYYEGKEFETRLREKKPGDLSEELRTALGMPVGPNCHKVPPPWLIAQQRYGPPPSYPNLKIPGLNAPIPESCAFGYHAGGWGKPPVDEHGKPLYGDVFGHAQNAQDDVEEVEVDRTMWGELESESEGESSEEESEGEEMQTPGEADQSGLITPGEGLATPSGMSSSVPLGLETPETIELRKKKIENDIEGGETPVLYQVLAERRGVTAGMMASTHVYDMTGAGGNQPPAALAGKRGGAPANPTTESRGGAVELALDPSELELDADAMAARYEQQLRAQQNQPTREDLSDMLADHVARQKSKRKRQQTTDSKQAKKYKEFKF
ncbi:splicing factor 3b subunit 2 [Arctopsyche grandis]|uniref:splicing factor 3b subunit 2 n=1 Tax=Arctopsyche grandis TaxID=121162 RepID=UPI00406D8C53